jgi:hypothetical protein
MSMRITNDPAGVPRLRGIEKNVGCGRQEARRGSFDAWILLLHCSDIGGWLGAAGFCA